MPFTWYPQDQKKNFSSPAARQQISAALRTGHTAPSVEAAVAAFCICDSLIAWHAFLWPADINAVVVHQRTAIVREPGQLMDE